VQEGRSSSLSAALRSLGDGGNPPQP